MTPSPISVLVVDDHEPWRRFGASTIQKKPELQIVGEAADGLEAFRQAQKLHPDLILLDIGLPTMNGIEAARRIREVSPTSKVIFMSENRSWDIAEGALATGASGYVVKSDAGNELLPAVEAVLQGKQFLSTTLAGHDFGVRMNDQLVPLTHCHELAFYADDTSLVEGYARFIESTLEMGNVVIVVVTESHRASLVPRLEADGVNVAAAIEQGSYIPLDSIDALSQVAVDGMPDRVRCAKVLGDLTIEAAKGIKPEKGRVAVCGEIAPIMLSKGNAEGAIELEHMWDEITRGYGVHTLCGYVRDDSLSKENNAIFQRICAEHSAVQNLSHSEMPN
jgi:CheY-like chemotaxis protein